MVMLLGFLIAFATGWSVAACEALFRAEQRPGIFRGASGMIILLLVAGIGGLTIAYSVIWLLQSMLSAGVLVILAGGLVLGSGASRKLHVTPAGAANRMMIGLAVLVALYGVVWTWLPPAPPGPAAPDPSSSTTPAVPISK